MLTRRAADGHGSDAVDKVGSLGLDRLALVILGRTGGAVVRSEDAGHGLLHAARRSAHQGNGRGREEGGAAGGVDDQSDEEGVEPRHNEVEPPCQSVGEAEARRPARLPPRAQAYNMLDQGYQANTHRHVQTLQVAAELVGRELGVFGRVDVQAAGHSLLDLLQVVHLLVEAAHEHPEVLVVQVADERVGHLALRLVPAQVGHLQLVLDLGGACGRAAG